MTMRSEIQRFQKETCTVFDLTGVDNEGEPTYSNERVVKCSISRSVWTKNTFDGAQRDIFTKISLDEELSALWEGLVFLDGADTSDIAQGSNPDIVRPVYDENGRFAHTVLEL